MPDYSFDEDLEKLYASEMAFNILHIFVQSNSQRYSKQVTDRLNNMGYNTSKESVSNYIKRLRDAGFLERGKRTKAQYYKPNYELFYQNWRGYVLYLLDTSFTNQKGESVSKEEVVQEMIDNLRENEDAYAPTEVDELNTEEIRDDLTGTLTSLEEEMKHNSQQFSQITENNSKLEEFFKMYVIGALETSGLSIHEVFIRILFRETLILTWKHEEVHEDLEIVAQALSACQLSESSTIGSGERAYEVSYGKKER